MTSSFTLRLADRTISATTLFPATRHFCRDYLTDAPADFSVEIVPDDLAYEREKSAREDALGGIPVRCFPDEYLETLALYRKIAEGLLEYDTLLFHGSVIALDGEGYCFTAKSGTGKSTHTRLWREQFGRRAVMVNDDKPLLRLTGQGVLAYGTPWDGKHRLSNNISVPLKAICILSRSKTNRIEQIAQQETLPMLIQQSYRPADEDKLGKTLMLADRLGKSVKLYRLGCNMEPDAPQVAYDGMMERKDGQ